MTWEDVIKARRKIRDEDAKAVNNWRHDTIVQLNSIIGKTILPLPAFRIFERDIKKMEEMILDLNEMITRMYEDDGMGE